MSSIWFSIWLLLLVVVCACSKAPKLTSYNVDTSQITVSGFSSGGFFAVQFHVAYSGIIRGAGVIAGGPFWCARNSLDIAFNVCRKKRPDLISIADLVAMTYSSAAAGVIDDPSYLKNSQIYTLFGQWDSMVLPGVVKKLNEYYLEFVTEGNVTSYSLPAQHSFPTEDHGNSCSYLGSPYISRCGFDAAREILLHMYPGSHPPSSSYQAENLFEFDQSEFYLEGLSSMDTTGYIYVPTVCQSGKTSCKLHVAFHGCQQGKMYLQDEFPMYTGYGQNAEGLQTIVLFPQVVNSTLNPKGCWDWWGYTSSAYASKLGLQMAAVRCMVERVARI